MPEGYLSALWSTDECTVHTTRHRARVAQPGAFNGVIRARATTEGSGCFAKLDDGQVPATAYMSNHELEPLASTYGMLAGRNRISRTRLVACPRFTGGPPFRALAWRSAAERMVWSVVVVPKLIGNKLSLDAEARERDEDLTQALVLE